MSKPECYDADLMLNKDCFEFCSQNPEHCGKSIGSYCLKDPQGSFCPESQSTLDPVVIGGVIAVIVILISSCSSCSILFVMSRR